VAQSTPRNGFSQRQGANNSESLPWANWGIDLRPVATVRTFTEATICVGWRHACADCEVQSDSPGIEDRGAELVIDVSLQSIPIGRGNVPIGHQLYHAP